MTLSKIYKQTVLYSSIVLLIMAMMYSIIYCLTHKMEGFNSNEFWTKVEFIFNHLLMALMYCVGICILSFPIFLNRFKQIRSNRTRSVLSWFLLPVAFMCAVIGKAINEFVTVESSWEITYAIIACFPFIVGLWKGFRKFKSLNKFEVN